MKKIIITERQMALIVKSITESSVHSTIVKTIGEDLDFNYEPAMGVHEIGNEFYNTPLISKKVNGENITPRELLEYMQHKYKSINPEFIKQTITDWYNGRLKNNDQLSKNISVR